MNSGNEIECAETAPRTVPRGVAAGRILHVISGLFYGGGQRVVVDLLRELPAVCDGEIRLCTLGSKGTVLDDLADGSVEYDGKYNSPKTLWQTSRALRREIQKQDIDLVHTHGVDADLIGALAVRGSGVGQVCHLHITPPASGRGTWKSRLRRKLLRFLTNRDATKFIAVSEAVRQQMAGYYGFDPKRITTIRNGINTAEFGTDAAQAAATNGSKVVLGSAARLEPMKGLEHLIDAAGQLVRDGRSFELRIAGSGRLRQTLERQAEACGADECVRFAGQVSDMPSFYSSLDMFVLPSVSTEGLPLVVLEAMAGGTPVVATRLAGTPEVIEDGVTGLLVAPRDTDALAAALKRMIDDLELRRRIGSAGRQHVLENFTARRMAEEVAELYAGILAGTSAA